MHLPGPGSFEGPPGWGAPSAVETPETSPPFPVPAAAAPPSSQGVPVTGAPEGPPPKGKVCVLLSSEGQLSHCSEAGGKEYIAEAGVSLFSLLSIYRAVTSCGYTLEFVTPSGAPPPVASFGSVEEVESCLSKKKEPEKEQLLQLLQQPQQLGKAAAATGTADYCCLLLPHHLGAAIDLYKSSNTGVLIRSFLAERKPIGALGYGGFALCAKPLTGEKEYALGFRV